MLVWNILLSSKLRNGFIITMRLGMSITKSFRGKGAVNTTRITVFRLSIPDVSIVLRAKEMPLKLLLTSNCYVTDDIVQMIKLPTRGALNIIARKDRR